MSDFKTPLIWSSPVSITVPAQNTWSAWTTVWTPPFSIPGFQIYINPSSGSTYGATDIFIGSGTPSSPATVSHAFMYDANKMASTPVPLFVPGGVPIQIRCMNNGTGTGTYTVTCFSLSHGNARICQTMGSTASADSISIGTSWALVGTTLALPLKRLVMGVGNNTTSLANFSVGIGPSTSAVTTVIGGVQVGTTNATYTSCNFDFDLDLPPSQNIYLMGNTTDLYAGLMLYY